MKLVHRLSIFSKLMLSKNTRFLGKMSRKIHQKPYTNTSYVNFVPRELKSIKNCFRIYIGGSDTTFLLQYHRFFDFFQKNRRPESRKKSWKSRNMKIKIWVFYGFVSANMYCNCVLNWFKEFFYDIGTTKFLAVFSIRIIEIYIYFTSIFRVYIHHK